MEDCLVLSKGKAGQPSVCACGICWVGQGKGRGQSCVMCCRQVREGIRREKQGGGAETSKPADRRPSIPDFIFYSVCLLILS